MILIEFFWGILQTLGAPWFLNLLAFVFIICLVTSFASLKKPKTKADIRASLNSRNPARLYRRTMLRCLKGLYHWLTPEAVEDHPKPSLEAGEWLGWHTSPMSATRSEAGQLGKAGWSWPVMEKAVFIAVVYPTLIPIFYWSITGLETRIGSFIVLESQQNWRPRTAVFGGLIVIFTAVSCKWPARALIWLRQTSVLTLLFAFAAVVISLTILIHPLLGAGIGGVIGLLMLSATREDTGTHTVSVAAAFAIGFAVVHGTKLSPLWLLPVLFVVGAACAVLLIMFVSSCTRTQRGLVSYFGMIALVITGFLVTAFGLGQNLDEGAATILVFLGLFPLINALFDFVSFGATLRLARWGLSSGTGTRAVFAGLLDLGIALILFTALGATLLVGIAAMNGAAGHSVLDLQPLFDSLRSDRAFADNWWIFAMLFSTAIPTLAHFCIAAFAAPALLWRGPRMWLLRQMDQIEDSLPGTLFYNGGMAGFWTLALMGPVALIGGLGTALWLHSPLIGQTYLQIFEWVAVWLGLIEQGGPGLLPEPVWV